MKIANEIRVAAPMLRGGELVILESTSPPGTTRKMSEWIAVETVRAALQDKKFRLEFFYMRFGSFPLFEKFFVAGAGPRSLAVADFNGDSKPDIVTGAGRHRNIEFGSGGFALPGLLRPAGPGVKKAPVFVQINEDEIGILVVRIKHAVAVMHVDINIGNAPDLVFRTQRFDDHA